MVWYRDDINSYPSEYYIMTNDYETKLTWPW